MILGDILTLLGATLYAISNVGAEKFVKEKNQFEYLAMIGIWGFLVSGIQMYGYTNKSGLTDSGQ